MEENNSPHIKPYAPLLLMTYVFVILFGVSFLFPEPVKEGSHYVLKTVDGKKDTVEVPLYKQESFFIIDGDTCSFKFFSFNNYFHYEKEVKKTVKKQIEEVENFEEFNDETLAKIDSATTDQPEEKIDLDKILQKKMRIQYKTGRHQSELASFFKSLVATKEKLIRVLHFGDSQLEGDRITSQLRNALQKKYGGCGCGFVPVSDASDVSRGSVVIEKSDNWNKQLIYGTKYNKKLPKRYSVLGNYFYLNDTLPVPIAISEADSLIKDSLLVINQRIDSLYEASPLTSAYVKYKKSHGTYAKNKKFETLKFWVGHSRYPFSVKVSKGEDTIQQFDIANSNGMIGKKINYDGAFTDVGFHVKSKGNPTIYGASFDCNTGIAVDNIGLRGAAGLEIMRLGSSNLRQQIRSKNVKFIIFQFGINSAPGEATDSNYFYNIYNKPLRYLKQVAPDVSILVVGISDMSKSVNGKMVSLDNIEIIRNAQRKAAFNNGCGFFDLYDAMGGKNSMPAWVEKKMAGHEYTHFTSKGARIVANMLHRALMLEYEVYKKSKH